MGELDRYIDYLPQKPPFLFVDEVTELVPGESVRAAVVFGEGHRVFENHLPGEPLVPGVILIEAMAQVSGLVLVAAEGGQPIYGYLGEVRRARFRKRVGPGSKVELESRLVQSLGRAFRFETVATVDGEVVAEGELLVAGGSPGS